jgi:hypothetical protein
MAWLVDNDSINHEIPGSSPEPGNLFFFFFFLKESFAVIFLDID